MKAFLDTHAVVGLYEGDSSVFSRPALDLIERSALFISPIVQLELSLLREIGRFEIPPSTIIEGVATDWGVGLADDPIGAIVARAMEFVWTRDPFDRLLVATAMLHRAPFITRDQKIRENFEQAVW